MKTWTLETRRWNYSTYQQITTKQIIKKGILNLCAAETHENCKHEEDTIVLRKGTRVENICFYESLRKIVLYLRTPEQEKK